MKTSDEIKRGLECLVCYGLGCDGECDTCSKNTNHIEQEDLMQATLEYIYQLEQQNAEQAAWLEQVTRERDALKADILRATDQAREMQEVLDYDVHPNCDYGLYCELCDALGDVVTWEHGELLGEEAEHEK